MKPSAPHDEGAAALAVVERARDRLRIDWRHAVIDLAFADGIMTMEGEVGDVAAKKLALERVAALPEVSGIVDCLRVRPANSVVTLVGFAPSAAEREMAEFDAWYVFGVDRVINRITVKD